MKLSTERMIVLLLASLLLLDSMTSLKSLSVDAKSIANFSEFELEKQMKIIQTTYGDIFECVDFYKQPAIGDLSAKHNSFHYDIRSKSPLISSKPNNKKFGYLWKNGKGCSIGTIPIKRVTKEDIIRSYSLSKTYHPQGSSTLTYNQDINDSDQHHFAVSRTKDGQGRFYTGASMSVSPHNPKVTFPQYSSSRMHVQIGDDFIQMGWTVNPKLYSDNKTRTFVYTKAGEKQCYNSMCPTGFISVRSDIPLGLVLSPNIRGSEIFYTVPYSLQKDKANGNWYFKFAGEVIGFWPANRFKQNFANKVEWGGEVYDAFMPSPQMGNGFFPDKHPRYDATISNLTTVNEKFEIDDYVTNTEAFSDNTRAYKVKDDLHSQFKVKHMIHYGGPGNI